MSYSEPFGKINDKQAALVSLVLKAAFQFVLELTL
jgi:hypothetical protein